MAEVLKSIEIHMRHHFRTSKNLIGMNQAAMKMLERQMHDAGKQDTSWMDTTEDQ